MPTSLRPCFGENPYCFDQMSLWDQNRPSSLLNCEWSCRMVSSFNGLNELQRGPPHQYHRVYAAVSFVADASDMRFQHHDQDSHVSVFRFIRRRAALIVSQDH